MARPRAFDTDQVLETAMQVFWSRGVAGTTLDDLCAATGLSRSSLYASFGDKRDLLQMALERYDARSRERFDRILNGPDPIRGAMADFLSELVERIVSGVSRRGCFLGNCAAELAPGDEETIARVRGGLERVEGILRAGLERARRNGELAADTDPDALAKYFVAGIQGMRLIGKIRPERAALSAVAATMLRVLD
jgi:TetR/AcrR family transcriptional regulator, transcriptional repressor for nem operon